MKEISRLGRYGALICLLVACSIAANRTSTRTVQLTSSAYRWTFGRAVTPVLKYAGSGRYLATLGDDEPLLLPDASQARRYLRNIMESLVKPSFLVPLLSTVFVVWDTTILKSFSSTPRNLRNSVKAQLAQARREFLGRQLLASDRKEFWSSLRRFYLAPSASAHSTSDKSAAEQRARADRFNEFFASETLKLLIETHVFPHILYCISVWGGTTKNQLTRIQKLINFSARIVTGVRRRERIGPALASLGWPRVERLVWERDLLKVWKALHIPAYPLSIRCMFVSRSEVSGRVTRSVEAGALELQKCRLSSTQRTFSYRAAAAWNRLPPAVREQPTLTAFRRAVAASEA
ncbi:hypothetical protein FJT64_009516 [Amphibalanus amphitrite]|uniref:Uncharacterized protein n=1 Tax=Amphibalanus amphitrite TaxID=1232801 RepID=A0A6A4VF12_AMPAM|nr:hypothetical protein FJT64_009516 [Amphibalanus amphitrite]